MKEIPLTQGKVALVDDEDYEELSKYPWSFATKGYATRNVRVNGGRTAEIMHRVIMRAKPGQMVDHINQNKLDNRKCNLRFCSYSENQYNKRVTKHNSSGFKGVSWHRWHRKWGATISVGGKQRHLGYFKTAEEAAKAYNEAAIKLHGEFACLNEVA